MQRPKSLPLFIIIAVPCSLQILIIAALTGGISFYNSQKAINDLSNRLRSGVVSRIDQYLTSYLGTPSQVIKSNIGSLKLKHLDLNNKIALEKHFASQLQVFPSVNQIYLGRSNGSIVLTGLDKEQLISKSTENFPFRQFYQLNAQGDRIQLLKNLPAYDVRTRPWYQQAVKGKDASWSEVYTFAQGELGITIAQPLPADFEGVMGVDLTLDSISSFIKNIQISTNSQVYIVERTGVMIASSSEKPTKLLQAQDSSNPLISGSAKFLKTKFSSLNNIDKSYQLDFNVQGKKQFLQTFPYQDRYGLDWLVVVVVPEDDFMAEINAGTFQAILLSIGALIVAIASSIYAARWISRPISSLSLASQELAGLFESMDFSSAKFDQSVNAGGVNELTVLAESFNTMANQLRVSFLTLEERVAMRTTELATANALILDLNNRLKSENFRMSSELEVTRRLQQMILPAQAELDRILDLDIAAFMESADEVGGDYYDVLSQDDKVKIGIGDITGHGLESGVIMIMVQTAIRTLQALGESDSGKFLSTINEVIYENVRRMKSSKNLSLCLLDYQKGTFYLSGQHENAIVIRSLGTTEIIDTDGLGFPIGLIPDISDFIDRTKIELNSGDVLFLYTDGITEAENPDRELYGLENLINLLQVNYQKSVAEIKQALLTDVRSHIGNQKVYDDITFVVIKQK